MTPEERALLALADCRAGRRAKAVVDVRLADDVDRLAVVLLTLCEAAINRHPTPDLLHRHLASETVEWVRDREAHW
jgi:hypothetical protein